MALASELYGRQQASRLVMLFQRANKQRRRIYLMDLSSVCCHVELARCFITHNSTTTPAGQRASVVFYYAFIVDKAIYST